MNEIQTVKLNAEEQALFDSICWDLDELGRKNDRIDHLEKLGELAESLLGRDAIPTVRVACFIRMANSWRRQAMTTRSDCGT
jgi:hypothetical protein